MEIVVKMGRLTGCCAVAIVAGLVAACSSNDSKPDLAPTEPEPVTTEPVEPVAPLPTGPLSAAQINQAIGEKTFRYAAPGRNGTVSYYSDGTFSYDEAGKGQGTGLWQASEGKLCEARNPTSFLPKGTPSICTPISSDGRKFTVGTLQLTPA